jgi:hypothetical protein
LPTLPLNDIINITVSASQVAAVLASFNVGLIVGDSTVISASDRVKVFTDPTEMITGGFTADNEEYKAAVFYFSQNPRPGKVIIGRWD